MAGGKLGAGQVVAEPVGATANIGERLGVGEVEGAETIDIGEHGGEASAVLLDLDVGECEAREGGDLAHVDGGEGCGGGGVGHGRV